MTEERCSICGREPKGLYPDSYLAETETGALECWPSCETAEEYAARLRKRAEARERAEIAADIRIERRRDDLLDGASG